MKTMLVILIRKMTKMVTEGRFKEMMIGDQSYHLVVIVIGITVRELTVMRKEAGVVKTMIGSEGVENMMTTTVAVDLVIKALVDTMIVIIASAIAGAGAERMRTNGGINRMVSGAIEMMDMKRVIVTGEMKSTTGKGAQKVDVGKTVGTVRETSTLMMDPIRRGGTEMVDRFPYNCRFCVACFPLMSTCITRSNFSVNQCNDLSYVEFL
jgi:hypothetical protein